MLSMTKIVVPLAIVLGSASAALAGPKDAFWPKDTAPNSGASVQHQAPTRASGRYTPAGSAYAFVTGRDARSAGRTLARDLYRVPDPRLSWGERFIRLGSWYPHTRSNAVSRRLGRLLTFVERPID